MADTPAWIQRALTPLPEDSADLRRAVETAAAMWSRGEQHESARWLHHAAHTAHGEGRQQRTADLTHAAAELDRIARESPDPSPSASMKRTQPYNIAPDDITRLMPPDSALLEECETSSPQRRHVDTDPDYHGPPPSLPASAPVKSYADRPRPPESRSDAEATLAAVRAPMTGGNPPGGTKPVDRTIVMPMFPDPIEDTAPQHAPPSPRIVSSPESLETTVPIERTRSYGSPPQGDSLRSPGEPPASSGKQISSAPGTLESPHAPFEPMRAVRVAIEPGKGSRLSLILLADGESAPEGTQEALLVALAPARRST